MIRIGEEMVGKRNNQHGGCLKSHMKLYYKVDMIAIFPCMNILYYNNVYYAFI